MPTYSYRCTECSNAFDIVQSFTDDSLTVCPVCGGVLRKVFSPVGVSFTGSGFYRTDSRAAAPGSGSGSGSGSGASSSSSESSGAGSSGTSGSSSSSAPKKETPAATPAASSSSGGSASS